MELNSIIQEIHNSDLYGTIVECGCGCCITDALMSIDGASFTIFSAKQPYAKEIQKTYYGENWERSVSREFIESVLEIEWLKLPEKGNFVLAASFQLGSSINNQLGHGWIGLCFSPSFDKKQKVINYYHFSFPFNGRRNDYFNEIKKVAIEILHLSDTDKFYSKYLDKVSNKFFNNFTSNNVISTLYNGLFLLPKEEENFITITPSGIIRFEDLVRDKQGLILQKGTYNPLHEGHLDIMTHTQKQFPEYVSAFMVSIDKYDKNSAKLSDLEIIIENILQFGYNVVVCKKPLFKENLSWIRQRWTNLNIIFSVGIDTINRIVKTEVDEYFSIDKTKTKNIPLDLICYFSLIKQYIYFNTKFLVFKRQNHRLQNTELFEELIIQNEDYKDPSGISSTKIRNRQMKNKLNIK